MKFISVTEHYGYCYEKMGDKIIYVIYRTKNGKPVYSVCGMKKEETAIKECEYLEKLNEWKWRNK